VVRITAPGGAGYGDPLDRDPEMVLTDIANGFVRAEEAAAVYGVVLAGDCIDLAATQARRETLRNQRSTEEFVFGPERAAYENRLPSAIQDLVAELLTAYPAATRQFLRDRLYEQVASNAELRRKPIAAIRRELELLLDDGSAQRR
jgi:N-methylhydantoinase B